MKHIDLATYPRKDIYLAFRHHEMPHLSVTVDVDITNLKALVDKTSYGFFLPMAYLAVMAANGVVAFRQRIL